MGLIQSWLPSGPQRIQRSGALDQQGQKCCSRERSWQASLRGSSPAGLHPFAKRVNTNRWGLALPNCSTFWYCSGHSDVRSVFVRG